MGCDMVVFEWGETALLIQILLLAYFFFSSRRRHTRCGRDWSSDVCSSDLTFILDSLCAVGRPRPRSRTGSIPASRPDRRNADTGRAGVPARLAQFRIHYPRVKIGRASCRERVKITVVEGAFDVK